MSQHLRVIVGLLDDLTLKDMETRLANWLLKQCPRPVSAAQVEIKLNRTKRVLAAEMGTTSETLSRTLAKFRDQKLLRVKGNTVVVTKAARIAKAAATTSRRIVTAQDLLEVRMQFARVGILEKLNRTIPLRLQPSAAEYNAHGFRAIPILPGGQLASQAQSSR